MFQRQDWTIIICYLHLKINQLIKKKTFKIRGWGHCGPYILGCDLWRLWQKINLGLPSSCQAKRLFKASCDYSIQLRQWFRLEFGLNIWMRDSCCLFISWVIKLRYICGQSRAIFSKFHWRIHLRKLVKKVFAVQSN